MIFFQKIYMIFSIKIDFYKKKIKQITYNLQKSLIIRFLDKAKLIKKECTQFSKKPKLQIFEIIQTL